LALAVPTPAAAIFVVDGSLGVAAASQPGVYANVIPRLGFVEWFAGNPGGIPGLDAIQKVDTVQVPNPAASFGNTTYFGADAKGNTIGKDLGPFSKTYNGGPAPENSQVFNKGQGKSTVAPGPGAGVGSGNKDYTANWSASATGQLGTNPTNGLVAGWQAVTVAEDPWDIDASNFAYMPGSTFDLFFMAGLTGADLSSPNASLDFDISYQTGAGTQDLLDVTVDRSGVHATEGTIAGLEIYRLAQDTDGALDVTGSPLTASRIQALLQGLSSSGQLTSSVLFGFELSGQPIPTQDLGGGVVAWMNVDGAVTDSAVAPEPASLSLFAAGGILIAAGRLRKRKPAP